MRRTTLVLALVASAAALAGCSTGSNGVTSAQSEISAQPPTTSAPESSAANVGSVPAAPAAASSPAACTTSQLSLVLGAASGAAGTTYQTVWLVNKGSAACRTGGYPGASFLDTAGHEVGLSAQRDSAYAARTLTIAPGARVSFFVGVPEPGNFPASSCKPAKTARLRVYPPNQTVALTVADVTDICSTSSGRTEVSVLGAPS